MGNTDLHSEYISKGNSIYDLFDRHEEGFYVPLYQREYTWEEDNINQLFDDLVLGTQDLVDNNGDNTITFLGTTILTNLHNTINTVRNGEEKAIPTAVQLVIDGQQRISTISILAIQLETKLNSFSSQLRNELPYSTLKTIASDIIQILQKLYSVSVRRGTDPPIKPKIIRAKNDLWTSNGGDDSYKSPIAHYVAKYIRTENPDVAYSAINNYQESRVCRNIELINQWLDNVSQAHVSGSTLEDHFPTGTDITTDRIQNYALGFRDNDIKNIIDARNSNSDDIDYYACSLYQLFLLTYYLLRRCGVNLLQPTHEEWGFDMFQALNATGTPLTAMETFLPQVIQSEEREENNWEDTTSSEYMDEIEMLFDATKSNEQKNQRTNELLVTFALCYEGFKLGNKFSAQRKWLTKCYDQESNNIEDKRLFLNKLSSTSNFYYYAWYMDYTIRDFIIYGLEEEGMGEFASLLVQYLKTANSKLSAPILNRFYSQYLSGNSNANEFIEATKACAAFFTLWRSANTTSGLPEIYRNYFRGERGHNWKNNPDVITSVNLKSYFWHKLSQNGINAKDQWKEKSKRFLNHNELKTVSKFVLFLTSHDRVADDTNPGLTVEGNNNVCPMLQLSKWESNDCRSVEHIAPQKPPTNHSWDPDIYSNNLFHEIGNLTLLPIDINKYVDNKEWSVKYIHYCHLGERNREYLDELQNQAEQKGIRISQKAKNKLTISDFNCAIEPIIKIGYEQNWNAEIINERTNQMKDITWDKLYSWLQEN